MYFYSTVLALTSLTAGVRALPSRNITARHDIGGVFSGQDGQAPGASIIAANTNCTGDLLPLGCTGSLIQIGSSKRDAHPLHLII